MVVQYQAIKRMVVRRLGYVNIIMSMHVSAWPSPGLAMRNLAPERGLVRIETRKTPSTCASQVLNALVAPHCVHLTLTKTI